MDQDKSLEAIRKLFDEPETKIFKASASYRFGAFAYRGSSVEQLIIERVKSEVLNKLTNQLLDEGYINITVEKTDRDYLGDAVIEVKAEIKAKKNGLKFKLSGLI